MQTRVKAIHPINTANEIWKYLPAVEHKCKKELKKRKKKAKKKAKKPQNMLIQTPSLDRKGTSSSLHLSQMVSLPDSEVLRFERAGKGWRVKRA